MRRYRVLNAVCLVAVGVSTVFSLSLPAEAGHHWHRKDATSVGCNWDGINGHNGGDLNAVTRDLNRGCGQLQVKMWRFIDGNWIYNSNTCPIDKDLCQLFKPWPVGGGHFTGHNAVRGDGVWVGFRLG